MEEVNEKSPSDKIIENAIKSETIATDGPMIPKGKEGPRKKGRPRKIDTEPQKAEKAAETETTRPKFDIPSHVICYPLVKAVSVAGVAIAKDQRAAITSSEAEDMARAMGMVMDKWMPAAMAKWGPEVMLGLSLGQYGLRVYALAKANDEKRRMAPKPEMRPENPGPAASIHSLQSETPMP